MRINMLYVRKTRLYRWFYKTDAFGVTKMYRLVWSFLLGGGFLLLLTFCSVDAKMQFERMDALKECSDLYDKECEFVPRPVDPR